MKFRLNKLFYKFRIRDTLELLVDLLVESLNRLYLIKRKEINDTIAFINAIAKTRYNNSYKIIDIK